MRRILGMLAVLALPGLAQAEPFGNAGVMSLHRAGLAGEAILAKIRSGPCDYDTSTSALIARRQAGVPQAVIVGVITRCSAADAVPGEGTATTDNGRADGIYMSASGGGAGPQSMLRPAAQSSLKTTGNWSMLFPFMARLIVPQVHAQTTAYTQRPIFYFYFNPDNRHVYSFGEAASDAAQSPNEFSLVHFRSDGGNRQVPVGRIQPYVAISGIDPKLDFAHL